MNIKLYNNKYLIKSDAYCYILCSVSKNTNNSKTNLDADGNVITPLCYPGTVSQALSEIIDRESKKGDVTTIEEYADRLEKIHTKIMRDMDSILKVTSGEVFAGDVVNSIMNSLPKKEEPKEEKKVKKEAPTAAPKKRGRKPKIK